MPGMNHTVPDTQIVLDARGIELGYRRPDKRPNIVLRDFSLQLMAGEVVAILGPSGVGKSSLLRVLAGLQNADKGTVHVKGELLAGPHPRLGFVDRKSVGVGKVCQFV